MMSSSVAFARGIEGNDVIKNPGKQLVAPNIGAIGKTKRVIVPSVGVEFLWSGDAAAGKKVSGHGVSLRAKYVVTGLEKADAQNIAKAVYDDLVQKLRSQGWEVLTYDDIKTEVADLKRWEPEEGVGLPTRKGAGETGAEVYAVAAPSDEMQFQPAFQGSVWPFRKLAKDKDANVFYPIYTVRSPRPGGKTTETASEIAARLNIQPFLAFTSPNGMIMYFITPKGVMGDVAIRDWFRMSEAAGTPEEVDSDSPEFKGKVSWFYKMWVAGDSNSKEFKSRSKFVAFRINKPVYTEAVMKGTTAFNDVVSRMTAAQLK
jgi:hypothetical protein